MLMQAVLRCATSLLARPDKTSASLALLLTVGHGSHHSQQQLCLQKAVQNIAELELVGRLHCLQDGSMPGTVTPAAAAAAQLWCNAELDRA